MSRKFAIISCVALLFIGVALWSVFRLVECRRITSPDGRFYAVAECRAWRFHVAMSPGSSGDKPGYVTVFTRDGQSCGSAPLDMAWMIDEMSWSTTNAELRLVAEWDLVQHRVHVLQ
jgi:hypothetical protein